LNAVQKTEDKPVFINKRPLFFAVLLIIAGNIASALMLEYGAVFLIVACLCAVSAIALFVLKRKSLAVAVASFLLGLCLFSAGYAFTRVDNFNGEVIAEARVKTIISDDRRTVYILDSVTLNGESVKRNARLERVAREEKLEIGDIVLISGKAESFNYNPFDTVSMSHSRHKVNYLIKADSVLVMESGDFKVFDKLQIKIRENILSAMGEKHGGLALRLVFNDNYYRDREFFSDMRTAGLVHIFSVSGMHVGFFSVALLFLLRKLRVGAKTAHIITIIAVFIYALFAGLPPSAFRASVMLLVSLTAKMTRKRYDPLSALSLTAIILILFNPLTIYDLGFQMSASAILGIICFYSAFRQALSKRATNKASAYIAKTTALSLSANSFLWVISFKNFSFFGTYFVLANAIVLPIAGLTFVIILVSTVVNLIIPYFGFMFIPASWLFMFMESVAKIISRLPFSLISTGGFGNSVLLFIPAIFFLSKFIMVDKRYKIIIFTACISLAIILGSFL